MFYKNYYYYSLRWMTQNIKNTPKTKSNPKYIPSTQVSLSSLDSNKNIYRKLFYKWNWTCKSETGIYVKYWV